jgi:hypothetical protein
MSATCFAGLQILDSNWQLPAASAVYLECD